MTTPVRPAAPLYPVGLVVAGRRCLVVGGGTVAGRKVAGLRGCGAAVTVVAPEVEAALAVAAGEPAHALAPPLQVLRRPYRRGEAAGYRLVVTATGVAEVDAAVHADAEAAGVWVNSADDPVNCTFMLPAVHRDGPVSVAVATGGTSPALAVWIRRRAAAALGPGLGALAELLGSARAALRAGGGSTEAVDWSLLLEGPLPGLVRDGEVEAARRLLDEAVGRHLAAPPSGPPRTRG